MKRWIRRISSGAAGLALLAVAAGGLEAQGVTTAAVQGQVTGPGGSAVEGASVLITNTSTGTRYQAVTRSNGRYNAENVAVGGPYTIEARAIGFQPQQRSGIQLNLGQRYVADFVLEQAVVQLEELVAIDGRMGPARTGPTLTVGSEVISNLPTLGRNFTDIVVTSPQVVGGPNGGVSIGGQNNRFNNIQVDGGVQNDLFGLGSSGAPGGQVGAKPISIEAVEEFQILTAPFDVRQGNFTGGLVNAVTKSGTNTLRGSVFGYLRSEGLTGADTAGFDAPEFDAKQYGFTLGGPIIRDRVHFFVSADLQSKSEPFGGEQIGSSAAGGADSVGVGITQATADVVREIAQDVYGFDPGDWRRPTVGNPDNNLFGKITSQLGLDHQLELSHTYVKASEDKIIHDADRSVTSQLRDGYQLSNSGYVQDNKSNTTRLKLTSLLGGRFSNELILGRVAIRDFRDIANQVPLMMIGADRPGTHIAIGADRFSQANSLDQDIFEFTDNLTFSLGEHRLTLGTHNEFFGFNNVFFAGSLGNWQFADTAAFRAGTPSRYEIALGTPSRPEGGVADFNVQQWGLYAQDQWSPIGGLTLTAGLRVDVPSIDDPATNEALLTELGVNTGTTPSGKALWSPRLGFNYDISGTNETVVRGGIGIFSGRPPYVWVSNAFVNTGLEQVTLTCVDADVPTFTVDPAAQPTACAAGGAEPVAAIPTINYFTDDFQFPQNLKLSLGLDRRLPWDLVGVFDFLYTKSVNQFYLTDVNLAGVQGTNAEGRPLYGTFNEANGRTTRDRLSENYNQIIEHRNQNEDYAVQVTGQVQKQFSSGFALVAGYSWSRARDLMSLGSSIAFSNLANSPLDGTFEERNLRTSRFDAPHKLSLSAIFPLPLRSQLALIYVGRSGYPFTYVTSSDANADGIGANDPIYIPADAGDMSWSGTPEEQAAKSATFEEFIESQSCLQDQRGQIMERNSCRDSWRTDVNARLSTMIPTFGGQNFEIILDMFNVLNFIDSDWGVVRQTALFEQLNALSVTGYDSVNDRPIYNLSLPPRDRAQVNESRWRMQLGGRYTF